MSSALDLDALKTFLLRANMPHAAGTAKPTNETDGSRTITYSEGGYHMNDNFFGGEPYGGRLVIFYKDEPVFIEVYYGQASCPVDSTYNFLREALQHPEDSSPFRGPTEYKKGNLTYKSSTEGNISSHTVREFIYDGDDEIYSAIIIGGLVDQNAKEAM